MLTTGAKWVCDECVYTQFPDVLIMIETQEFRIQIMTNIIIRIHNIETQSRIGATVAGAVGLNYFRDN